MSERVNVFDASALLAYLHNEPGHELIDAAMDEAPGWVTSVNYCEVLSKLCQRGMPLEEAVVSINELALQPFDFDFDLARRAASLRNRTSSIGASLGDRACLALAERAGESGNRPTVYTADHAWNQVKWRFKIVIVRPARRSKGS
jgi:ribonuclease VapC